MTIKLSPLATAEELGLWNDAHQQRLTRVAQGQYLIAGIDNTRIADTGLTDFVLYSTICAMSTFIRLPDNLDRALISLLPETSVPVELKDYTFVTVSRDAPLWLINMLQLHFNTLARIANDDEYLTITKDTFDTWVSHSVDSARRTVSLVDFADDIIMFQIPAAKLLSTFSQLPGIHRNRLSVGTEEELAEPVAVLGKVCQITHEGELVIGAIGNDMAKPLIRDGYKVSISTMKSVIGRGSMRVYASLRFAKILNNNVTLTYI